MIGDDLTASKPDVADQAAVLATTLVILDKAANHGNFLILVLFKISAHLLSTMLAAL